MPKSPRCSRCQPAAYLPLDCPAWQIDFNNRFQVRWSTRRKALPSSGCRNTRPNYVSRLRADADVSNPRKLRVPWGTGCQRTAEGCREISLALVPLGTTCYKCHEIVVHGAKILVPSELGPRPRRPQGLLKPGWAGQRPKIDDSVIDVLRFFVSRLRKSAFKSCVACVAAHGQEGDGLCGWLLRWWRCESASAMCESIADLEQPIQGFIGFGAMDVTKPYKFIGFGAMDGTKPY